MKSPLIVSLLALAVSAVVLAILIAGMADSPRPTPVPPTAAGPDADLLARVDALAEEQRELRDRLASYELRPAPVQRAPVTEGTVSREEFEAFRDEVLAALGEPRQVAAREPGEAPSPAELQDFSDHVSDVLTEIRTQEAAGMIRSLEERTAKLDETMPELESWLELTRQQSDQMRSVLLAQYDREMDILRRWQVGEDPEVLGEMKRNDREVHHAELSEVLTPDQLATYTSRQGRGGK